MRPHVSKINGRWWVDLGTAWVGPYETHDEAVTCATRLVAWAQDWCDGRTLARAPHVGAPYAPMTVRLADLVAVA